jgi:hypothetical protein
MTMPSVAGRSATRWRRSTTSSVSDQLLREIHSDDPVVTSLGAPGHRPLLALAHDTARCHSGVRRFGLAAPFVGLVDTRAESRWTHRNWLREKKHQSYCQLFTS